MATEEPIVDDFDKAFSEIVSSMESNETPPDASLTPTEAPTAAPAVIATETATETPTLATEVPVKAEAKTATAIATETPAPTEAPTAAPTPAPTAAPTAAPTQAPETPEAKAQREAFEATIKPYEPTDEEKAALAKFKQEFPGEYVAVEAQFKAQKQAFNAQVYEAVQNVLKHVDPRLKSVEETTTETAIRDHVNALHAAHTDYDTVITKVPDWIKSKPAYLQPALQRVYDEGTTQDVIAMVADFKKETAPITSPVTSPVAPTSAPKSKPAGVDDLAPVSSRRVATSPKGTPDPSDFESAWKEAVAALG